MQPAAISLARGRVHALTRRRLDADAFRRALRAPLHDLVPFDGYCVSAADPTTLAVTSSVGDGLAAVEAARLFAIEHEGTDVNRLCDLATARSPVATIGAHPERSERMRTLFLPRGWVDELRAALVERGRCWGYLHLYRAARFTRAEAAAIANLAKDLGGALREAIGRAPRCAAPVLPGVVVVDREGQVLAATAAGAQRLASMPRDEAHEGPPHGVVTLAERALATGEVAEGNVPTREGLMRVVATVEGDCAVVVVDRAPVRDVLGLTLAHHRLSPREEEVCRAMLRGLSDDAIGTALGIETHTVKSHAKAVYAKLAVDGRGGLLALVDSAG